VLNALEKSTKRYDIIILFEAIRDVIKTFDKCAVHTSCLLISKLSSEVFYRQHRLNPFLNKQFFCNSGEDWRNRYGTKVSQTILRLKTLGIGVTIELRQLGDMTKTYRTVHNMSNNFSKFSRTTFKQPSRNVIVTWSCIFKISQHTFNLESRYASGIDCINIVFSISSGEKENRLLPE
jgi:hypothetical protein